MPGPSGSALTGFRWTADDIPYLDGRTAVVTGANSGIGYETAAALAMHGGDVILACRDTQRGEEASARIRSAYPAAKTSVHRLDLADLASVRAFASDMAAQRDAVDILVNNAGVMAIPHRTTADGFEMQFGTNHLGHFALTGLLLDLLLARPGARVVTVSSMVAWIGRIDFADLQSEHRYGKWEAYGQSKLANQLFAYELARRAAARRLDLVSVAAHPGYAATNLPAKGAQASGQPLMERAVEIGNSVAAQSAAAGALPSLYGATAPGVRGGQYFGPHLLGWRGRPAPSPRAPGARSEDTARRLWEVSEELTDVRFAALTNPA